MLKDKRIPLRSAFKYGFKHFDIAKLLMKDSRVDPSANNNELLLIATVIGHHALLKLLLSDSRVDPSDSIIVAAQQGNLETMIILLNDYRVHPTAENIGLVYLASQSGFVDNVKVLLADGRFDPSASTNAAIYFASNCGNIEIVKVLLADSRVDPSDGGNRTFFVAVINGHTKIVKLLLQDSRVDPSASNNKAIELASVKQHSEIVKILLDDERVDPSANNNVATTIAGINDNIVILKLLIADNRVDPSYAFVKAAELGHEETVNILLLDERLSIDMFDEAIFCAAIMGHSKILRNLLAISRGSTNQTSNFHYVLFHSLNQLENINFEIVKIFVENSRVDQSEVDYLSLIVTIDFANIEILDILLSDSR
ncbi:hypothetical protein HK096_010427, partial [Nowakowskiella sp. JEL0078]